jgi:hypothetical protein
MTGSSNAPVYPDLMADSSVIGLTFKTDAVKVDGNQMIN